MTLNPAIESVINSNVGPDLLADIESQRLIQTRRRGHMALNTRTGANETLRMQFLGDLGLAQLTELKPDKKRIYKLTEQGRQALAEHRIRAGKES